ncbi:hypothetical protein AX16_002212 [Volvariella volvacea WC 439]|nr:hypothetical protein AX16_002212 [Volvariella volvacea WC 439]
MTASRCDSTRTRTIFDILYNCIGVILLCTYISVHHNIPDQDDSRIRVIWLKTRTTLYALIAPEMVILWAIRQRMMAGRIAEKNKQDRRWTRTHGFFVQMGGLMQRQIDSTYKVLCSEKGVEQAKIPHIPEQEIKDRGKGEILAKAVVVGQTTWFILQCIARHVQGLVLTEIELVTLAFATLNVVTYGLWWDKPLNVGYPIYFDENGNRIDGPYARADELEDIDGTQMEWKGAWYERVWRMTKRIWRSIENVGRRGREYVLKKLKNPINTVMGLVVLAVAAPFMGGYYAFVAVFSPLAEMMSEEGKANRPTSVHPFYAAEMNEEDGSLAIVCASVVGVVFGGIHLIGWHFQFSTTTELWLWGYSSLVLTIIPLVLAIGYALIVAHKRLHIDVLEYVASAFLFPSVFVGPPLYFAARMILLFLAFFTLHALPDSAHQNVRWTEYLPHI